MRLYIMLNVDTNVKEKTQFGILWDRETVQQGPWPPLVRPTLDARARRAERRLNEIGSPHVKIAFSISDSQSFNSKYLTLLIIHEFGSTCLPVALPHGFQAVLSSNSFDGKTRK